MTVNFATIDKLIEEGFLMDSRFNSPAEIASLVSKSGVTKSMLSLPKMILLGLMAGAFIAVRQVMLQCTELPMWGLQEWLQA